MVNAFDTDLKYILNSALTPDRLPALVEHNAALAAEALVRTMGTSQISAYATVYKTCKANLLYVAAILISW